ncbi:Bug family tripartite tricarboxylate transporter substrate binding protein [Cupriavidus sp. YAF13]|uniref:Bug family tripartite tricarboxylate transporter substrate binding protein n=1 Tax=Cupriavidus sp. YAF13 TaxID=3233075 RepID=UPI003F9177AE
MFPNTSRVLRAAGRLLAVAAIAFPVIGSPGAHAAHAADKYPAKTVRLIVPNSPGSTADVVARVVAEGMGKDLGQPFYVENLPGAAGIPGTRQLVSAAADGYTLAVVSSNHAINPGLYRHIPYDSVKDITAVGLIGTTPLVLVVGAGSPYKTVQELVAAARAHPGSLSYGSSSKGSVLHLAGELLKSKSGIDMLHVPYKGVNTLMTDVLGGQINAAFLATPSALPQIKAGKLRALAVSTPARLDSLPAVPTLAESGVKDYAYDAWIALVGPAGLPKDICARLQQALVKALAAPKARELFAAQGFVVKNGNGEETARLIRDELGRSQALIKSASIVAE